MKSTEKTVKNSKAKGSQSKRCEEAGRKPFREKLEYFVLEWFHRRRKKGLHVSRKFIMKKVKTLHGWYMIKEGESSEGFLAIIASCKKYLFIYFFFF